MNSDNETYFDRFGAVYISKKKKVHRLEKYHNKLLSSTRIQLKNVWIH